MQSLVPDTYSMIVRDETLVEGAITVEGAATAVNSSGDGCLGVICKYIDRNNWVAVRYGAYSAIMVAQTVEGQRRFSRLRHFICKIGTPYTCEVRIAGGVIVAALDGKPVGVIEDPFRDRSGRPGIWSQSPAEFYRMSVDSGPQVEDTRRAATELFAAGPRIVQPSATWSLEHVGYSVAPLAPTISRMDLCTIALYVRNRRGKTCSVTDITLDGKPSSELIDGGRIAWWRCWPQVVPPNGMAQVLVKMSAMTMSEAVQAGRRQPVGPYRVRLSSSDGQDLELEFALEPRPARLRINFIAFGPELKTVYVYLAAEGDVVGAAVQKVEVNGLDVTTSLQGTARALRADTLPLRINLKRPSSRAAPTVVTVHAEGDAFAGHAVRAFPSRFPIQITILGKQPGPTAIEELANLCFTDVGLCGGRSENISEMRKRGLLYFPYAYPSAGLLDRYLSQPERPPIGGWWIDEIDGWKKRPRDAQNMLTEADQAMRDRKLPLAPYCMNIMAPWNDEGYIELADALSHEYGIDRGINGLGGPRSPLDFGNPADIATRELRTARKPWWPYFRNIEAVLLLKRGTKEVVKQYRPIDPREYRLYVYSCLANGAKGALNWNYGVNYLTGKRSAWFSKEYDAIRLNMTALKDKQAFGVAVPEDLLDGLKAARDECGRVNAELQLLGPMLALGDISDLARVVTSVPKRSPRGGPAAHARALVCGLDTIVVLVVNLNIASNFNARKPQPVDSYEPVDVELELTIPPWLKPQDVFSVSCRSIEALEPQSAKGVMQLHFRQLPVAQAVVVTQNRELRGVMQAHLTALQERLRSAGVEVNRAAR